MARLKLGQQRLTVVVIRTDHRHVVESLIGENKRLGIDIATHSAMTIEMIR